MSRPDDCAGKFIFKTAVLLSWPIILLAAGHVVHADEFHYSNQLVGDRAAGMGGAYTAVADDPAGTYYNPAGIVYSQSQSLTASSNTFSSNKKTYKSVLGGRYDWERESYSILPNFFGIVQPLGAGYVGLSFAAPDLMTEDQDQQFNDNFASSIAGINVDSYTINIHKTDNTYKFGPSYALEFNKSLAIGLTAFFHYRDKDFIKNEYVMLDNYTAGNAYKDYEWTNYYEESFEYGIEPILGIMWAPMDKLSVGLRVSQVQIYSSDTTYQNTSRSEIKGVVTNSKAIMANHDDKRKHPVNTTLGLAYFASESLLLSGDAAYYSAVNDSFFGDRNSVLDLAVGMEWYFTPKAALRMGLFSQNANTAEVVAGGTNQKEHLDTVGLSASLTSFSRNSSITAGLTLNQGDGEVQLFSDNTTVQEVDSFGYAFFLSTSYSY